MMTKSHFKMNNQAKIILASFIFFALDTYEQEITPKMKKYFRKLSWVSEKYQHHAKDLENELNGILIEEQGTINSMLMSVTLLNLYYDLMRGKKRLFTPMSYAEILDVQEECIELSGENTKYTCDLAEIIVRELLKENK